MADTSQSPESTSAASQEGPFTPSQVTRSPPVARLAAWSDERGRVCSTCGHVFGRTSHASIQDVLSHELSIGREGCGTEEVQSWEASPTCRHDQRGPSAECTSDRGRGRCAWPQCCRNPALEEEDENQHQEEEGEDEQDGGDGGADGLFAVHGRSDPGEEHSEDRSELEDGVSHDKDSDGDSDNEDDDDDDDGEDDDEDDDGEDDDEDDSDEGDEAEMGGENEEEEE